MGDGLFVSRFGEGGPRRTAVDTGEREDRDMAGAGTPQDCGSRTDRGAGGEDIVHQQNPFAANLRAAAQSKSAGHVGPALRRAQACLRIRMAAPFERAADRYA